MGTDRAAFHTDSEHLGLNRHKHAGLVVIDGKDLIQGILQSRSRSRAVRRNVLESVRNPDIHGTWRPQLLCKILGNADACLHMVDPEFADL